MSEFIYERRVSFSDTDAMGVVHHANYLRFCEEARVAWMRARGLSDTHYPHTDKILAVLSYRVWHLRPATFEDLLEIRLQVRRDGLKIQFQYAIYKGDQRIAEAETVLIPIDRDLRPVRPNARLTQTLEKEPWTETWLSNL